MPWVWVAIALLQPPPAAPANPAPSAPAPAVPRTSSDVDIRELFVPADELGRFRDPKTVYHLVSRPDLDALLKLHALAQRQARHRTPRSAKISARVDAAAGRIVGTSRYVFGADRPARVELAPWSPRVIAVRDAAGRALDWGCGERGALVVDGLVPGRNEISVDWDLPGAAMEEPWSASARAPNSPLAEIEIIAPEGWSARGPGGWTSAPDGRSHRLRFGGAAGWDLDLLPPAAKPLHRAQILWRAERTFAIDPARTDFEGSLQLSVDRAPIDKLRIHFQGAAPREIQAVGSPADWTRDETAERTTWTATFRRPIAGAVEIAFRGTAPTVPGANWSPPEVSVDDAVARGERNTFVVDPALRLVDLSAGDAAAESVRLDSGSLRATYRSLPGGNPPSLRVEGGRSDVAVARQSFTDVARDRVRHFVRLEYSCLRGEFAQAVVWVPDRWSAFKATSEPSGRLRPAPSPEPAEGGGWRLRLPLARPLATGERLAILLSGEIARNEGQAPAEDRLLLPEVRPAEEGPATIAWYSVRIDPGLPYRLTGAESEDADELAAGRAPDEWRWGTNDALRFRYAPPLARGALEASDRAATAAFDADLRQVAEAKGAEWHWTCRFELTARRGNPWEAIFESSRPLPPGVQWRIEGADNSIVETQSTPAGPRIRHRIRLSAPIRQSAAIVCTYRENLAQPEAALWSIPDAGRVETAVEVRAAPGAPLEVEARGVAAETVPASEGNGLEVAWRGRYDRLPEGARLALRLPPPETGGLLIEDGSIAGSVERGVRAWRVTGVLRAAAPVDRFLAAPKGSVPTVCLIDGRSVLARVKDSSDGSALVFVAPLARGAHRFEIVLEEPAPMPAVEWPRFFAASAVRFEMNLPAAGTAAVFGAGRPLSAVDWDTRRADENLRLVWIRDLVTLEPAVRAEAMQILTLLEGPAAALGIEGDMEPADALAALAAKLPSGWPVLVDGPSFATGARRLDRARPRETAADWFAVRGLFPRAGRWAVAFFGRPPAAARDATGARVTIADWLAVAGWNLRAGGGDPLGRLIPAAAAPRIDERTFTGGWSGGTQTSLAFASGASPPSGLELMRVDPNPFARRFALFLAAAAGVIAALLAPRRRWLAVTTALAIALLAESLAAPRDLLAVLWTAALAGVATALVLGARRPRPPVSTALVAGSLLLAALTPVSRAQDAILVPFDPAAPKKTPEQAVVSDGVLRKLQESTSVFRPALILRSAEYAGAVQVDGAIRWRAALDLYAPDRISAAAPFQALLELQGAGGVTATIDGAPVRTLPPSAEIPLAVTLTKPGRQSLLLEFTTVAESGAAEEFATGFRTPAAAANVIRLQGLPADVELTAETLAEGFRRDPASGEIRAARGPIARWQARWRRPAAPPKDRRIETMAILAVRPANATFSADFLGRYRLTPDRGAFSEIEFALPPEVTLRDVKSTGLDSWRTTGSGAEARLVLKWRELQRAPVNVAVEAILAAPAGGVWETPRLLPVEGTVDGYLAYLPANPAQLETKELSPDLRPSSARWLSEAWRDKFDDPPPPALKVREFSGRNWRWRERAAPARAEWTVDERHALFVGSGGGFVDWTANLSFSGAGAVDAFRFRLPSGLHVRRVDAPNLYQWFEDDGVLTLRLAGAGAENLEARIEARLAPRTAGEGVQLPEYSFATFQPIGGTVASSGWQITAAGDLAIDPARPKGVVVAPRTRPQDALVLRSTEADPRFDLTLRPGVASILGQSVTIVRERAGALGAEGRLELRPPAGRAVRWECRSPRRLGKIAWQVPADVAITDAGLRGEVRIWTFVRRGSLRDVAPRITLAWRADGPEVAALARDAGLQFPIVAPVGVDLKERWVVLSPETDAEWNVAGRSFRETELPADLLGWFPNLPPATRSWTGTGPDFRLALRRAGAGEGVRRAEILSASLDLRREGDSWRGRSSWTVRAGGAPFLEAPIPASVKPIAAFRDDEPVAGVAALGGRLPLPNREEPIRWTIEWTADAAQPAPILRAVGKTVPLLARMEGLAPGAADDATDVHHGGWLLERLRRAAALVRTTSMSAASAASRPTDVLRRQASAAAALWERMQ
ncbi:MAG TPA: hypothetical protein VNC50_20770, partial [Planctomycetia bacterium]|nr:hypothetical protein [Planctomycetia bacterium]